MRKPFSDEGNTSTIDVLSQGLHNLKESINRCISADNIDDILGEDRLLHGVIKIFNAKDYFNKNLFTLENYMESTKKLAITL